MYYPTLFTVVPPQHYNSTSNYYAALDNTITSYDALDDMAALHHYLQDCVEQACTEVRKKEGPPIIVENGNNITPQSDAQTPLAPALSRSTQHAFLFESLKKVSLLFIWQLCDDDCIAIFTKYDVNILKNNTIIITGKRNANGLQNIPITPTTVTPPNVTKNKKSTQPPPSPMFQHQANGVLRTQKTKQDLTKYHSGSLFNPRPSTLLRAICTNNILTFPGLTTCLISTHLPTVVASLKEHLAQEQKNLQLTTLHS